MKEEELKASKKFELKVSEKYLTKERRGEVKSGYKIEGGENFKRFYKIPCMKEASSIYKKKKRERRDKDHIKRSD